MTLTLLEIKEKVKDHLRKILDIDDFRIVIASLDNDVWSIGITYFQDFPSSTGQTLKIPVATMVSVDSNTGEILKITPALK
jgi:hypothetical protein